MVRVRAVLNVDTGMFVEYVTPRMDQHTADHYIAELVSAGHVAEKVYEDARPLAVREIVPL